MGLILDSQNLQQINDLKRNNKTLVLAGGCFDILHKGHIEFLKKAREKGDILVVLLESDERIKKLKGKNRPVNTQGDRAAVLSNLPTVSYVINLMDLPSDHDYEILVKSLKPDIIAITAGNRVFDWERDYADSAGVKILEVVKRIKDYSTSKLVKFK